MARRLPKILMVSIFCLAANAVFSQPIIVPGKTVRHNLQIDTRGNHLSGMMIARPTAAGPRVLATSYFGPTIFDFTLAPDSLKVNSCVEPMRRPKVLALLERDLRVILVDRNRAKLKKQTPGLELRKSGHGFSKSVFTIIYNAEGNVEQVRIKHPWIRLRMTLEELKDDAKD